MRFLDTNAVIAILRDRPAQVRVRLRRAFDEGEEIALSTLVVYELWYGVARSERRAENAERLKIFLAGDLTIFPFDEDDAALAGGLRAALEAEGRPIGPYDLLIAAQAVRLEATLVTANVGEFGRVPGLTIENWATP